MVGHLLYFHGQRVCGRKPRCAACVVSDVCPSAEPAG
jgi:endonuclease-3